jgi:hypothetical protein
MWVCDLYDVTRVEFFTPRNDEGRIRDGIDDTGKVGVQCIPSTLEVVGAVDE